MSRSLDVKRKRRLRYRNGVTPFGRALHPRVLPCNPDKGAEDVPYTPVTMTLPVGDEITISNRSGDRKKI